MPANAFNGRTNYGIGIGLRVPHYAHILEQKPVVDWFEIISENFMGGGGRPLEVLDRILEQYRVVQHGVSMYFGSAEKPDREHLKRLKALVQRTKTPWLSDHLCWGSVDGTYTHDLLPMPYTIAAAKRTAEKIRQVRDFLEVPICVENVSSYAEFHVSEMTEWEFLTEVVERADCGILLDVNNIYVSSQNHDFNPYDYLDGLPHQRVGQMHIAGHTKFEKYLLDTHDHPVLDPVWKLYAHATQLCGVTATLLEWDDRIPSFDEVHDEALKANEFIANAPTAKTKTPRAAPARLDSTRALRTFQRLMKDAVVRPLAPGQLMQKTWRDGRPMADVAAEFIKPNERLTAFERLQIYNRMYWFRIIDSFYEDGPGLRAAIGERKFAQLATAYLTKHPSSSFTLRNLGSHLEDFIRAEPRWTAPHTALAREIARFEWAQTVAFDEAARPVMTPEDFARANPAKLKLGLQPYVGLLALEYAVDNFVLAVKKRATRRGETSNATTAEHHAARVRRVPLPRRERIWMAIHRLDNRLYYKRLDAPAFKLLVALRDGQTLTRAVATAGPRVTAGEVQDWFALWTRLGWLCRRE